MWLFHSAMFTSLPFALSVRVCLSFEHLLCVVVRSRSRSLSRYCCCCTNWREYSFSFFPSRQESSSVLTSPKFLKRLFGSAISQVFVTNHILFLSIRTPIINLKHFGRVKTIWNQWGGEKNVTPLIILMRFNQQTYARNACFVVVIWRSYANSFAYGISSW